MDESERTLYLTEIICPTCDGSTTIAHEGRDVGIDQDAPWPYAENCSRCGALLPQDLSECIGDIHVAETVDPEREETPEEVWERHNDAFNYEPPQKRPEQWSSEEVEELTDRVISRRTEWFCDKCSGRGPIGSLRKARRHVEKHVPDLLDRYAPSDDELEAATDGGESSSKQRASENRGLDEFAGGESGADTT